MSRLIAIVGRPNVGKSALFNRIARQRIAIVHDQPGVTRDRISAELEWQGRAFSLVDTGGIGLTKGEKTDDVLARAALEQVELAIQDADVILLVVNVQEGLQTMDGEVAKRLHQAGKRVIVAVNKSDNSRLENQAPEFSRLGFEQVLPVSALHGSGMDRLMELAISWLPEIPPPALTAEGEPPGAQPLKLAIVGRPNVGKSSLVNALTQAQRVIVSPIPGTTRDAVDVPFEVVTEGQREKYVLIDTAGLRKTRRVDDSIEFYSVKRAEESIRRCDLVVFVLDAEAGILEQDKKIADLILEARKACVVVVNKWDLVEMPLKHARKSQSKAKAKGGKPVETQNLAAFADWVQEKLFFLDYAPVIFASAASGFHLDRLLEAVRYVAAQLKQAVPTAILNRTLNDAIERRQPVSATGLRLKFFYATQIRQAPPTFLLFVSRKDIFSPAYEKYLVGELRKAFGFEGCPIGLIARPRPKRERTEKPPGGRHKRDR
jgi:GTP-binding protein